MKRHIKGTNGRTVCGIQASKRTDFVEDEENSNCERCIGRYFIEWPSHTQHRMQFERYRDMKKALARLLQHVESQELIGDPGMDVAIAQAQCALKTKYSGD